MEFATNSFDFDPRKVRQLEEILERDGYLRIQFSVEQLPKDHHILKNMESFFIEVIESLGGQCLKHNEGTDSIVWHVQPMQNTPHLNGSKPARSHTDEEFPFHTDCSYEENPPEYIALFVLEPDQLGGGQFQTIRLDDMLQYVSVETKEKLLSETMPINIPEEFRKRWDIDHINGKILLDHNRIRYRDDIILGNNSRELDELRSAITKTRKFTVKLEKYTMIILNNQTYLHGRTKVLDHRRHLLRIRFDRPFPYNIPSTAAYGV